MAKPAPSPTQTRIGRAVRERRNELGLSLGQVAADLGVAVSTISKLENGLLPITFERLEKIGRLLNVDVSTLVADAPGAPSAHKTTPAAAPARREDFGTRRSITRAAQAVPVEGGVYALSFHATDLLDKRFQPIVAEVQCRDIKDYGPLTRHDGEEWNLVVGGTLEFHTDVYAPVILKAGDSIYFDAEMGHAHIRVGDEPCVLAAVIVPRSGLTAENASAPVLEVVRAGDSENGGAPVRRKAAAL